MKSSTTDTRRAERGPGATVYWSVVTTPIGPVRVTGDEGSVSSLYLDQQRHRSPDDSAAVRDDARLRQVAVELEEYFAGQRTSFDVRVDLSAGTAFQRAVWEQLLLIAYGETVSYGELAARLGSPGASRAVGLANGRNPISIIVPCHRVVGATGKLTGYGGGLDRKRWLLEHERAALERDR